MTRQQDFTEIKRQLQAVTTDDHLAAAKRALIVDTGPLAAIAHALIDIAESLRAFVAEEEELEDDDLAEDI
jgi:hypothetical protein